VKRGLLPTRTVFRKSIDAICTRVSSVFSQVLHVSVLSRSAFSWHNWFLDCDFANSHDNLIESILNKIESQNRFENQQMCLHGFNAALASAAVSIIRDNFMTDLAMFLKSFAEIPSARRKSIIRLLLSASSIPNLLQLNNLICNCHYFFTKCSMFLCLLFIKVTFCSVL